MHSGQRISLANFSSWKLHTDNVTFGLLQFFTPQGPNLDGLNGRYIAAVEAGKGLEALPYMAEIWPLGGQSTLLSPLSLP